MGIAKRNLKIQTQLGGRWPEILNNTNGCYLTEHDLKKQSQFAGGQMNATICSTKTYENNSALRLRENEPDQSQTRGFARKRKSRTVD
jgi:hypothetical protein